MPRSTGGADHPHHHGLDRRHRELRLGRVVGAQPGRPAGGKGLEPLVVQAPATPLAGQAGECRRARPARPGQGSLQPHRRPEPCRPSPRSCCPDRPRPKLPAGGIMPTPSAPKPSRRSPRPRRRCRPRRRPRRRRGDPTPPANAPTVTQAPSSTPASESGPSIASLIESMSGPTGGWRVQIASVKNEDVAKSTWARLQARMAM